MASFMVTICIIYKISSFYLLLNSVSCSQNIISSFLIQSQSVHICMYVSIYNIYVLLKYSSHSIQIVPLNYTILCFLEVILIELCRHPHSKLLSILFIPEVHFSSHCLFPLTPTSCKQTYFLLL